MENGPAAPGFDALIANSMLTTLRSVIVTGLASYSAFGITAMAIIGLNHGYGLGDIGSYLVWSLPLAFLVAAISQLQVESFVTSRPLIRCLWSAGLGAAIGALYTLVIRAGLGPWFGAFSFPVLYCWMAGGAIGMISAGATTKNGSGSYTIRLWLILAIVILAVAGAEFGSTGFIRPQRLEILLAKRIPGPGLVVTGKDALVLSVDEMNLLRFNGVTGTLSISAVSAHGRGKNCRTLIIMDSQVGTTVDLPQPDGNSLVYVQHMDKWEKLPADARTQKRSIRLEVSKSNPKETICSVELATGAYQGGSAVVWE